MEASLQPLIKWAQTLTICFTEFLYHLILSFPISFFRCSLVNTRPCPALLVDLFIVNALNYKNAET
jgi:hypothetical protein